LAYLVVASGALSGAADFIEKVAGAKMTMPAMQLFLRGVLCNWLVCLALWTSSRTKSDATKCILIFWCLFAFIACGYEHSIANMTLLSMSLFAPHGVVISWLGFFRNMFYVTMGNIVGGSFFVGALYCIATYKEGHKSV
jgi:nitrite transporter NirC